GRRTSKTGDTMTTVQAARDGAGMTQNQFSHYVRYGLFSTEFAPAKRAVGQPATRANCLEIYLLAALVRSGAAPRDAKRMGFDLIRRLNAGEDIAAYAFDPRGLHPGCPHRCLDSHAIVSVTVLDALMADELAAGGWTGDSASRTPAKPAFAV